jgi:anti-sigma B factor antagonist
MSDYVALAIEERDDVILARVSGELDLAGARRTGEAIAEAVPTSASGLVVDFTQLDFIDSSGVAMLFDLVRRLTGRRQQLRLVTPGGSPVARVLDIVEFERAAPVHDSVERALAEMRTDGG